MFFSKFSSNFAPLKENVLIFVALNLCRIESCRVEFGFAL